MRLHHLLLAALTLAAIGCGGSGSRSGDSPQEPSPGALAPRLAGSWVVYLPSGDVTVEIDEDGRVTGGDLRLPEGLRFERNALGIYEARNEDGDRWHAVLSGSPNDYLALLLPGGGAGLFERAPLAGNPAEINDDMVRATRWRGVAVDLVDGYTPISTQGLSLHIEPTNAFTVDFERTAPIKSLSNTSPVSAQLPTENRQFVAGYQAGADPRDLYMLMTSDEQAFLVFEASEAADEDIRIWLVVRDVSEQE